ncbi:MULTISPECIES: type VI secretion system tube protein TssD [Proteus]|uniref:type VI secretion system tube protein TssD n=1 Tax=Proteus TaxID=583 RepID=UPI000B4DF26D|nr:type VI secretion system tube protein TssD [Proteus terrae]MDY3693920.1 type VI secretion system tube protein TssD [Proteus mirabilis]PNL48170.1 type VI secretion system tube protein Hcp [Proteus mirabilis]
MSNNIYLRINGNVQGNISAGCSSYDSLGNKYQSSHLNEILVIASTFDISRRQNLSHAPLSITKHVDKSTPLLITAITNNEILKCEIDYYRTSHTGAQEKYMTVVLTNASIINYSQIHASTLTQSDSLPSEIITIQYESITCNHIMAGTSGYSISELS